MPCVLISAFCGIRRMTGWHCCVASTGRRRLIHRAAMAVVASATAVVIAVLVAVVAAAVVAAAVVAAAVVAAIPASLIVSIVAARAALRKGDVAQANRQCNCGGNQTGAFHLGSRGE